MTTPERVREACRSVVDPCSAATGANLDVVEMGLLRSVDLTGGHVDVGLRLTTPACEMAPYFVEELEACVGALPGVESVTVTPDHGFEWSPEMMTEAAARRRREARDRRVERVREAAGGEEESGPHSRTTR